MTIEATVVERDWWWAAFFLAASNLLIVFGVGYAWLWAATVLSTRL